MQTPGAQTPEQALQRKELRQLLLSCIDQLSHESRHLFHLHEFEEVSFKKLFDIANFSKSFASFKRWYRAEVYERVKACVVAMA